MRKTILWQTSRRGVFSIGSGGWVRWRNPRRNRPLPITHVTRGHPLGGVRLSPVGLDDLSSVRYVHITAFRSLVAPSLTERETEAWLVQFYQPAYTERLIGTSLLGAWVGRELVGTAGWTPHASAAATARIDDLFVHPMFAGNDIGQRLMTAVEASATQSGYKLARADVPPVSAGYFEARDYRLLSRGMREISPVAVPVVFMAKDL
ncbi:MAG: hypothetical protein CTY20_08465 [Hyphomicrobium sp.]|nr:MAG: hypothetical protein CTY20_08465 [Hyphomicrobium sp.]